MLQQKLDAIKAKRSISEPLPLGSAPYTSSNLFKICKFESKPKVRRWDNRLSDDCLRRRDSTLKAAARTLKPSTMISLGTARPAPQYFPWEFMTIHATASNQAKENNPNGSIISISCAKENDTYGLSVALNYGYAAGSPQLLRFITEHVEIIHKPLYDDWETCLTCGTTSAIEIIFRMLCKRGDWILCESYTYSGTTEVAQALGLKILAVDMDNGGLSPEDLDLKLSSWNSNKGPKPSVLYTIPTGQNPTGITQTTQRRKAIYDVAERHDLIIIEDDPYYFIQLAHSSDGSLAREDKLTILDGYLAQLPTSYLSLDSSGRVIRLDTTSKILAPGLRCGWMTGCSQLVEKFINYTELSTVSPSGPSQLMLFKLLDGSWGHKGLIEWLGSLSSQYGQRLFTLAEACKRHLPHDICSWKVPNAGMFLWIRLHVSKHPAIRPECCSQKRALTRLDMEDRVYMKAKNNGVLISKGSWFAAGKNRSSDVYFRLTFASAPLETLAQALEIFATTLREEFMTYRVCELTNISARSAETDMI